MIGVIEKDLIFEFKDESDLSRAISWFGDRYSCSIIIITDRSDRIKGVIDRGQFTFAPTFAEDTVYTLYGLPRAAEFDVRALQRNDDLPRNVRNWELMQRFKCVTQRIPGQIGF